MSDLLQSAILGISIGFLSMLAFNILYSIKNNNIAKSKREKSRKTLEEEISKLKSQRSFLARKFTDLSEENDSLKLVILKKTKEITDLRKEAEKLEKENKVFINSNKDLISRINSFLSSKITFHA